MSDTADLGRGVQGEPSRKKSVRFPAWTAGRRPDRFTLLLAALAVLGAVLILARQVTYGVGLHGDWVTYISVARSLLAGEGFVQIHGWPYLHWPPLYPMLLAAASLFAFDPYDVAGPLNAAVFGLTLFVAGQYLRRHVQHPFLVLWACLALMLAIPLTRVASHAISEAPFILFVTLSLADVHISGYRQAVGPDLGRGVHFPGFSDPLYRRHLDHHHHVTPAAVSARRRAIGESEAHWLVPVDCRVAGGAVAVAECPGPRKIPWAQKPAAVDVAGDSGQVPERSGRVGLPLLAIWECQSSRRGTGRSVALLALAMSVCHAVVRSCRKVGNGIGGSSFHLFGGFALVYLVFLTASQATTEILPLGERYLSPAYIPLLFAAVFALDKFLENLRRTADDSEQNSWRRGGTASLLLVALATTLSLWLAWQVVLNVREIRQNNEGRGLGIAAMWVNSEILRYIEEHLMAERIFSNVSSAIYLRTDHADLHYLPPSLR